MPIAPLRSILLRLAVLAAVVAALPAGAQRGTDQLRAGDLRGAPPRLLEAIAQLRPHWLRAGDSPLRVAVFLNGRHVGDARVLEGIATEEVVSARLRSPDYVRSTDARFPREAFDAAIYVAVRGEAGAPQAGRVTVSLAAGFDFRSLPEAAQAGLAEVSYAHDYRDTPRGRTRFPDQEARSPRPVAVGGGVYYGIAGPWGIGIAGQYTGKAWGRGYSYARDTAATVHVSGTEAALLVTHAASAFRVGGGIAYRHVDAAWASGFCQCRDEEESTSGALGLAAEGQVQLPVTRRLVPGFQLLARYYPFQKLEYPTLRERIEIGGLVLTMGVTLGARF